MELRITTSDTCPQHQVRLSKYLIKKLNVDYGDWLIFNVEGDYHSAMVTRARKYDIATYGFDRAVVSSNSVLASLSKTNVDIEHHELTIGADPEFFVLDKKTLRLVEAYKILPFNNQLGCDGDLAELRPDYALSPEQLVKNISKLISSIDTKISSNYTPYSASYYQRRCCGFHVHLGMPQEVLAYAADKTDRFLKNLATMLDYFVGIPSIARDPDNTRRRSTNYGMPGDFRLNMRTLEYRTPGGFNLISPSHTLNLLNTSFVITDAVIKDIELESNNWTYMEDIAAFEYFQNKYNLPTRDRINEIIKAPSKMLLEEEALIIEDKIKNISDDYMSIKFKPSAEYAPFFEEWSKHEKKSKACLYKERG